MSMCSQPMDITMTNSSPYRFTDSKTFTSDMAAFVSSDVPSDDVEVGVSDPCHIYGSVIFEQRYLEALIWADMS